ncbi:6-carboxyhexanoate--CoA ligase [Sulfobacillus thermosulfidooxidans]|uniref:6-carboxyhexanoate--CoA ligase n=1 Tax=Sulfobacillus thermosulfidooxidans TaxID=28034 RepID=UPI0006B4CF42|nr:6-carboxyhexanoate--CoA ligase [Sulfobacillus thermosulfidooxidans]
MNIYSVRMRATDGQGRHLSGMERLIFEEDVSMTLQALYQRAWHYEPHNVYITVEKIDQEITVVPVLRIRSEIHTSSSRSGVRNQAREILLDAHIEMDVIDYAFSLLDQGPAAGGGNMRGAVLLTKRSGRRLEPDKDRGVRTLRVDIHPEDRERLHVALVQQGFPHPRTQDALILATKTLWAGVIAELGWSDDPDYTTGFVATKGTYWRFEGIKEAGVNVGGRIYFVEEDEDTAELIKRLQQIPIWVTV